MCSKQIIMELQLTIIRIYIGLDFLPGFLGKLGLLGRVGFNGEIDFFTLSGYQPAW